MLRPLIAVFAATAALLGAASAQAGTHWSIGVSLPAAGVVVSNGGYYAPAPAPVYYEPAPVYYQPAPVVRYAPAPRYVERDVYYAPAPRVVYAPSYRERRWEGRDDRWDHGRHERNERNDRWSHDRDDYGPRRGH